MKGLLILLKKVFPFIFFLLLEIVSLVLIFQNNRYQRSLLYAHINELTISFGKFSKQVSGYFTLAGENEKLARQNAELWSMLSRAQGLTDTLPTKPFAPKIFKQDSLLATQDVVHSKTSLSSRTPEYKYRAARVVNSTLYRQRNFITLNVGRADGVRPDMGVVSESGVVGIVVNVSSHYAIVASLLNKEIRISSKIARTGHVGSLMWTGTSANEGMLSEIPQHVNARMNDTIVTSGYSTIFPKGIVVGIVKKVRQNKGTFSDIYINFTTDFSNLDYVYVVETLHASERLELEKKTMGE